MKKSIFFLLFIFCCFTYAQFCHATINSDLFYRAKAAEGETLTLAIPLSNDSDKEMKVDFAVRDIVTDAEKGSLYEEAPHHVRSCSDWITLTSKQVVIPAKGSMDLRYTVKVPKNVPERGSYCAVIMMEPALDADDLKAPEKGVRVVTKVRYAYLLVVDIGTGEPKLKIVKKEVVPVNEHKEFWVDVQNIGQVMLRPRLAVDLYDPSGVIVTKQESMQQTILPNSSYRYKIDLSSVEPKQYSAFLFLDCEEDGLFGDRMPIDLSK